MTSPLATDANSTDADTRKANGSVTAEGEAFASAPQRLQFVATAPPEIGAVVRIAPGIDWARIPLPIDLNHINVWLLEVPDGYVLVDTGMPADECRAAWEALERSVLLQRPLRGLFITHAHNDHLGLASWLKERHRIPVWMSRGAHQFLESMIGGFDDAALEGAKQFLVAHGVTNLEKFQPMLAGSRSLRAAIGQLEVERFVADEEILEWGANRWRALETNGHADGHLCLESLTQKILISGDQILPSISSNVGLLWRTIEPNPLGAYLSSLERLSALDRHTLVLPSHGRPFYGLQARADDLRSHHDEQFIKLEHACVEPKSAQDLTAVLFRRKLHGIHRMLALAESLAHVEYLARAGRLERIAAASGLITYRTIQ
jgi:glyoxylase-like metal-dependent hydrolase (beta-lactamase superfamily II)